MKSGVTDAGVAQVVMDMRALQVTRSECLPIALDGFDRGIDPRKVPIPSRDCEPVTAWSLPQRITHGECIELASEEKADMACVDEVRVACQVYPAQRDVRGL